MSNRQLAAIMFTDIVGYTAIMGNDENHALAFLNKNRQLQKPIIGEFNGRWIKEIGDGTMASFNTVSDAVNAAVKIQEACVAANDFQLRIGIHQGEVVFENDDVFGDAVNIAARIQAAARPGCIFISEAVNHNITNKKDIKTQFVKEEILKNLSQPVRMYQVIFAGSEIIMPETPLAPVAEKSIAVLPFVNMSSDPEQEYFSDGISEEIINMLAQVHQLKVIARTSCFAFKGKNLDVKFIGEQLQVSHVLEGSVRRSGNKLRITAQLINVKDGFHLFSEKFDRELEDIFAIQDELSLAILNAVKIRLLGAEKDAVLKKYTSNVEAYQLYLKALFHYNKYTPDNFMKAIAYLEAAIGIEPGYAIAYSALSYCHLTLWYWSWAPVEKSLPLGLEAAKKSLQLDDGIAESHLAMGRVKLHYELKVKEAVIEYKKSIAINPSSAECHMQLAMCAVHLGNYGEADWHASLADRLDPFSLMNLFFRGVVYWGCGDTDMVLVVGKRLIELEPNFFWGHLWVANHYVESNRFEEAIAKFELAIKLEYGILTLGSLGMCYGLMGETTKAEEVIEQMKKIEGIEIMGNSYIGNVYTALGELDAALHYYDKAIEHHEGNVIWAKVHLRRKFRNDPRTKIFCEKLGVHI